MIFSASERAILGAFVEALLADDSPDGLVPPPAARRDEIVADMDDWLGHTSPAMPLGFRAILWIVDLLPLFVIGAFARMRSLGLAERIHFLERLEAAKIGLLTTAMTALKIPVSFVAYETGEALHLTGFDRPSLTSRRVLPVVGPRP